MPLYGNELDRDCTPAEAGLGRVVKLDKPGGFVGREALVAAAAAGPGKAARRPDPARAGHRAVTATRSTLEDGADAVGVVTSGSLSPTLGVSIAMAWLPPDSASSGYHGPGRHPCVASRGGGRRVAVLSPSGLSPERPCSRRIRRPGSRPREQGETDRWMSRQGCGTATITSGCVPMAAPARSASPGTPRTSWATWCSSRCPGSAGC